MNQPNQRRTTGNSGTPRLLALLVLFIGSGCAALIYEVVWFQLLELVIGSSAISLGVLLGTFMGGMCLGSLMLPRFVSPNRHPLRVYAFLELGIGLSGVLILVGVPLIGGLYTAWAGQGVAGMLLRGVVAGVFLLPPTFLMGATLPAISRWVKVTPQGVSWLGFFYGGNIGGAVAGSLLAGFYLLRVYDVAVATFVAVAVNVSVALISLGISRVSAFRPSASGAGESPVSEKAPASWSVYLAIGLSGMTALASEVIWTRQLSLLFGATVYTFSVILSVFLLGLGIGSSIGASLARSMSKPGVVLGWCQMLLCLAMGWTAYEVMASLPFWPIDVTLTADPWTKVQLDLVRSLWAVLPPALLWGASFPLALAAVARPGRDPGRLVGGVYAANTIGAIMGSLGASLVLVAWLGTQRSLQLLIGVAVIAGLFVLVPAARGLGWRRGSPHLAGAVLFAVIAGAGTVMSVPELPKEFVAWGRFAPARVGMASVLYVGEGMMASVAVSESRVTRALTYHNAGKVQASSDPADMRLQRMLGHLTTLVPDSSRNFLVIGFGAGVTAGAVSIEPKVEKVTVVEIEPLVPEFVSAYFSEYNFDVARNPKVRVVIDDGRHYLLTTREKFDGITSDPLDPWVKGAAALYTREFFEAAKGRLNPGGVVTQFVQLYESNQEAVKSEVATFFEVFPYGSIWVNNYQGAGYDLVLLGQVEPTRIDVDRLVARVNTPEYSRVARSLGEIGFSSPLDLLATFVGGAADLRPWLKDAAINRDRNLRLQYLAGLGLNLYQAPDIYRNMIAHGPRMPEGMFIGSEPLLETLARAIESGEFR